MIGAVLVYGAVCLIGSDAVASDIFSLFEPNAPIDDEEDFFSSSDYGGVGLLQTRTARFGPDGQFDFGGSVVDEYRRYYFNWHALPWLEATFRYTDIRNRLFSPFESFSGDQTFKDRGADVKIKLWSESKYIPAIAVGIQDGLGTGQFSGEYLVASKRWFDLDFSLGLGWGYFTGRDSGFKNPLRFLSDSFSVREGGRSTGGTFLPGRWFSGERAALFGGMEWRTPIEGLTFKLEYDPNDYQNEPLDNAFRQNTHWNVALAYRPFSWFDTSIGYERGTSLMVRAALRTNLQAAGIAKFLDDPPPALVDREEAASVGEQAAEPASSAVRSKIHELADMDAEQDSVDVFFDAMEKEGLFVESIELAEREMRIFLQNERFNNGAAGRAAKSAISFLPPSIETITFVQGGASETRRQVSIPRGELDQAQIVDHLFEGLSEQGYRVETVELTHSEALIAVTRSDGGGGIVAERRAARLAIKSLPTPIETVTLVQMSAGVEMRRTAISRDDIRRLEPVDDLFDSLEHDGFEVEWVDLSRSRATVYVSTQVRRSADGMRKAARRIVESSTESLEKVTLVRLQRGSEESRVTVNAAGEEEVASGTSAGAGRDGSRVSELSDAGRTEIADRIFAQLADAGFSSDALFLDDTHAMVYVTPERYRDSGRNIGRPARIVANNAPASVEAITIIAVNRGMELSRVTILRKDLERAVRARGSPEEIWANAVIGSGRGWNVPAGAIANQDRYPDFSWSLAPKYRQSVGGPDGFILYQIYAALSGSLEPVRGFRMSGTLSRNIVDTFDQLRLRSDSQLPRVRSDIARYLREGTNAVENLYADYVFSPYPEWYAKLTVGLLEKMYGGVAGEVLYRPFESRLAAGFEIARVRQRDFDGGFGFRDFSVTTGHLGLYYDVPLYDLEASLQIGRYLARDVGATFQLARTFRSGVKIGAFATLTDVPFDEFGEGSFDKGFFMSFPFDLFLPKSTRRRGIFVFRPLTRDGGQRVGVPGRLIGQAREGSLDYIGRQWNRLLD